MRNPAWTRAKPARYYLYIAIILGLFLPGIARADDDSGFSAGKRDYGAGDAFIYARYARVARGTSVNGLTDLATVGLDAHGFFGTHVGYCFAVGYFLGGGVDGTFAYGAHISPVGFGIAIGPSGYLMALGGVGFDGATSRIPLSATFPTELDLAFDVARRTRIGMNAGIDWVTNVLRANGVRQLAVGDELDLGTFVRIGRAREDSRAHTGRGYFFRVDRKGQMGTSFIGFSIGLELDASG
ncbi:MAG: hypothetical protein ACRELY_05585 [Polyangiaceae bacterium]